MPDQRSVHDQLLSLITLAHKNGLYDAADWVRDRMAELARKRDDSATTKR